MTTCGAGSAAAQRDRSTNWIKVAATTAEPIQGLSRGVKNSMAPGVSTVVLVVGWVVCIKLGRVRPRTAQQPAQQPGAAPAQHPASLSLSQVEHNLNSLYNRNEMLPWTCRNRIGTGTARAQKCVSYIRFHDFWNLFHSMKSDMKS